MQGRTRRCLGGRKEKIEPRSLFILPGGNSQNEKGQSRNRKKTLGQDDTRRASRRWHFKRAGGGFSNKERGAVRKTKTLTERDGKREPVGWGTEGKAQ